MTDKDKQAYRILLSIAREFVKRVEKGEVRSRYTYGKMKGVLEFVDEKEDAK